MSAGDERGPSQQLGLHLAIRKLLCCQKVYALDHFVGTQNDIFFYRLVFKLQNVANLVVSVCTKIPCSCTMFQLGLCKLASICRIFMKLHKM